MLLKRAEPIIEQQVLNNAKKIMTDIKDFKVYLLFKSDGNYLKNSNGRIAMKLYSDQELIKIITSGRVFSIID